MPSSFGKDEIWLLDKFKILKLWSLKICLSNDFLFNPTKYNSSVVLGKPSKVGYSEDLLTTTLIFGAELIHFGFKFEISRTDGSTFLIIASFKMWIKLLSWILSDWIIKSWGGSIKRIVAFPSLINFVYILSTLLLIWKKMKYKILQSFPKKYIYFLK